MTQEQPPIAPLPSDALKNTGRIWVIGIWLSFSWLLIAGGLFWWKWDTLGKLALNEWGDFLAGVVAPLALLWLVLGYFQQGIELRQNTEALRLQQEELARQVAETRELARNAARQAIASESLAALEADNSAREQRVRVAAAQPSFEFERHHSFGSGGHVYIANSGAPIQEVRISATSQGAQWQPYDSHRWDRGRNVPLQYSGQLAYPVVLHIQFIDGIGTPHDSVFQIHGDGRIRC